MERFDHTVKGKRKQRKTKVLTSEFNRHHFVN